MKPRIWPALALLCAACEGQVGTLSLHVVTAPGADPFAGVTRVVLTLSDPPTEVESERAADGSFALDLEVTADGQTGIVQLDGYDAGGTVLARGRTPPLPIAATDADLAIYVAAPGTFAEAPVSLEPARTALGGAVMPFGAVLAGGRDPEGAAQDEVVVYNVYDHTLQDGMPLPAPRTLITAAAAAQGQVYLFGGDDAEYHATASLWRFDTRVAPAGAYIELGSDPSLARSGAPIAQINAADYLVLGDPPVVLSFAQQAALPFPQAPPLEGAVATTVDEFGQPVTLIVGDGTSSTGAVAYRDGIFTPLPTDPAFFRRGHAAVVLPDRSVLFVGGADNLGEDFTTAIRIHPDDLVVEILDNFLAKPRNYAGVALAGDRVVVAGGYALDSPLGDAEVFDAETLEPLGPVPLVAERGRPLALALPNGQILLAGGESFSGPVGLLELYTP